MDFAIEKIDADRYPLFVDMVFWREHGFEREPSQMPVTEPIRKKLANPNLYLYAVMTDGRYVGWISLIYLPKVGRWKGHELWVAPEFRGQGLAKALMKKADALKTELEAAGIRLYVNVDNPAAKKLYERGGCLEDGQAYFMGK